MQIPANPGFLPPLKWCPELNPNLFGMGPHKGVFLCAAVTSWITPSSRVPKVSSHQQRSAKIGKDWQRSAKISKDAANIENTPSSGAKIAPSALAPIIL